jgi:hypothetical protein
MNQLNEKKMGSKEKGEFLKRSPHIYYLNIEQIIILKNLLDHDIYIGGVASMKQFMEMKEGSMTKNKYVIPKLGLLEMEDSSIRF